jgi:hypothetical protein
MFEIQQCKLNIFQTETQKEIGGKGKHSAVDRQLDCCTCAGHTGIDGRKMAK